MRLFVMKYATSCRTSVTVSDRDTVSVGSRRTFIGRETLPFVDDE